LRVEWAKAKARADRWEEEVILLDEEMRRILEFCQWKATWWLEQAPRRKDLPPQLAEGLHAYAEEQADLERRISLSWTAKWKLARALAQPILLAGLGAAPVLPAQEILAGTSEEVIELDIDDEQDEHAGDSDFEE
jgi:hypothetical protein